MAHCKWDYGKRNKMKNVKNSLRQSLNKTFSFSRASLSWGPPAKQEAKGAKVRTGIFKEDKYEKRQNARTTMRRRVGLFHILRIFSLLQTWNTGSQTTQIDRTYTSYRFFAETLQRTTRTHCLQQENGNLLLKTGRSSANSWIAYCPDLRHVILWYPANI